MFKKSLSLAALSIAAALSFAAPAKAGYIITIDMSGGNQPVNSGTDRQTGLVNSRLWNFSITAEGAAYFLANSITFTDAFIDAKRHDGTTASLDFTIYRGLGGNVNGNTVYSSSSLPYTYFDNTYQGNPDFALAPTPVFTAGYYSAVLSSAAPDIATQDYFVKQSGTFQLKDSNGNPLDPKYWKPGGGGGDPSSPGTPTLTPVPEPSNAVAMLAILAMGGVCYATRTGAFKASKSTVIFHTEA